MTHVRACIAFAVALVALSPSSSARADSTSTPPRALDCSAPEHHQFDFWIGEWDVTTPDDKPAGKSRIESVAGGCALLEHWTGAGGGSGKSLNFYSPQDRKWHQTWTGTQQSFLFLDGGIEDGKMVLSATRSTSDGGSRIERITWSKLDGGKVRQHWQQSTDAGKTWTDAFVGIYAPRKK